jgi:hypothetical protein
MRVTSLRHYPTDLENEFDHRLILLLDGTRDLGQLAAETGSTVEQVESALARLLAQSLLVA